MCFSIRALSEINGLRPHKLLCSPLLGHLGTTGLSWHVAGMWLQRKSVGCHPPLVISSLGVVPPGTAFAFKGARCLCLVTTLGNLATIRLSIIHDQGGVSGKETHQEHLEAQTRVSL